MTKANRCGGMSGTDWRKKYEAEHARRCDLERRFDLRISNNETVDRANALSGSDSANQYELRMCLAQLVSERNAERAEAQAVIRLLLDGGSTEGKRRAKRFLNL